ncbi:MAG: thermonuclease family protein [Bauldia litoralis]
MTVLRLACLLCVAGMAGAAGPPPFETAGLVRLMTVEGVTASGGVRFALPDGRRGRLAGLAEPAEPAKAKAEFQRLLRSARITLWSYGEAHRLDRYGRIVAHLWAVPGGWIQGRMLAAGRARVRTRPDDRALARRMLALEDAARQAKRGLWALERFRASSDTAVTPGGFRLVEGTVLGVSERWRYAYLNFGRSWRRDFTIVIDRKARQLFRKSGVKLSALKGVRVRVRGWVQERNGPMIEVSHPEQIERMKPSPAPVRQP